MRVSCLFLASLVSAMLLGSCGSSSSTADVEPADQGASSDASGDAPDLPMDTLDSRGEVDDEVAQDLPGEVEWPHGCVEQFCAADETHAPDPSQWGPFPIGVTLFEVSSKDYKGVYRKFPVEVWYPAVEAARNGPFESIDLIGRAPQGVKELFPDVTIPPIQTKQVRDALLRTKDGPYPLIIFSHGAFGIRFQSVFFTSYLASHGYVVASIDHKGNTLYDLFLQGGYNLDAVVESAFNRPIDVKKVTDVMLDRNTAFGDLFEGSIDPERIGMSGHSFGGYTSFAVALEDSRFKAILPMAPATQQLAALGMDIKTLTIPVMIMAGGMDNTLDTQADMRDAYDLLNAPRVYFELKKGGHFTFTDICALDLMMLAKELDMDDAEGALNDGCGDENISVEAAHPIIRSFGIAFFNYYLRNSKDSIKYFSAEAASKHEEELLYLIDLP